MPFVKWHGRDWLGDPLLRMVGPEVRGVWIDLLCAMMNAEPYGHLAVNGSPMSDAQSARLTGVDIGTFKGILKEIEEAGISSRTDTGMLFSRRLVRDYEKFMSASAFGKKGGGNPTLSKSANKDSKQEDNPESRSQIPEARETIKVPNKGTYKGAEDAAFAAWYSVYPKKTGRLAALKSWAKMHKQMPAVEEMIAHLKAQAASVAWTKDGGQFIPNPATYLNQGRWADEIDNRKPDAKQGDKPATFLEPTRDWNKVFEENEKRGAQ
jgi:hypothetical protein